MRKQKEVLLFTHLPPQCSHLVDSSTFKSGCGNDRETIKKSYCDLLQNVYTTCLWQFLIYNYFTQLLINITANK